jgi:hypothetical protein
MLNENETLVLLILSDRKNDILFMGRIRIMFCHEIELKQKYKFLSEGKRQLLQKY